MWGLTRVKRAVEEVALGGGSVRLIARFHCEVFYRYFLTEHADEYFGHFLFSRRESFILGDSFNKDGRVLTASSELGDSALVRHAYSISLPLEPGAYSSVKYAYSLVKYTYSLLGTLTRPISPLP